MTEGPYSLGTMFIDMLVNFVLFTYLFKCVPKHTGLCSEFLRCLSLRRFPKIARLQFGPKPKSSGLEIARLLL